MRLFEAMAELPGDRVLVSGAYGDLPIDDKVRVNISGVIKTAVVETRVIGGAVVRVIEG